MCAVSLHFTDVCIQFVVVNGGGAVSIVVTTTTSMITLTNNNNEEWIEHWNNFHIEPFVRNSINIWHALWQ